MVPAAAFDGTIERVVPASSAARLSHVKVFDSFEAAEGLWRSLEKPEQLSTPFQHYDFITAWQRNVGAPHGVQPHAIAVYDHSEQAVALLPLVLRQARGGLIACFPSGKHATFNMPLWRRDFARQATTETMQELLQLIAQSDPSIDALALSRQPESWDGVANPMALLPRQTAVNECPVLRLEPDAPPSKRVSRSLRKRLSQKERKLASDAELRYTIARSPADAKRLLDAFFAIKPLRLAAQGLPNVLAELGTEDFLREIAQVHAEAHAANRPPMLEIHALERDDEVIAVFAGVRDHYRLSMMFNTYTMSAISKYSPGLILIRNIIDHCATTGCTSIDLGTGDDEYKLLFCKQREVLFDSFLPLTMRGRIVSSWLSMEAHIKRAIKRSTPTMEAVNRLRRALQG